MEVRLGWETFLLIVRIEFICKSHALCNLSHGRMNIWGDSVHGQISFPYTQKTTALEQKTQKTTALEQKTVFRSRAAVFWVYGKLIWPWYEESNTWFLQAILSLGPDSEKVRLVLKVGFCATNNMISEIWCRNSKSLCLCSQSNSETSLDIRCHLQTMYVDDFLG